MTRGARQRRNGTDLNARSEGSAQSFHLKFPGAGGVDADLPSPTTSVLNWLPQRAIILAIGSTLAIAGGLALVVHHHLGSASAFVAILSMATGGFVAASFLVRSALPVIDRTLAQQRIRANRAEEQYRSIFENAVEGIFQTTPDGRYLKANPMLAQIYGYESPDELMASLTDIGSQLYIDEKRREEFGALLQSEDVVLNFDSQVRRRDGQVIWIRENARAMRDAKGRLVGYEGTVLDITSRRQAQEMVQQTRERERATAGKIQKTLLLAEPPHDLPWLEIGVFSQPSQSIDGDFYDFHRYDDNCIDILIGDVMGKGLPAALLGAGIKSRYLRAIATLMYSRGNARLPEPENVIAEMHSDLTSHFIGLEFFATMCYLRFDHLAGAVTFVDCGHAKTIHCRAGGAMETLESDCVPLGFSASEVYTQRKVTYSPGDMFLCYSDGVTEAADPQGEMFGLDRLLALVDANLAASPASLIRIITGAVLSHTGNAPLGDDLTVLVIRAV